MSDPMPRRLKTREQTRAMILAYCRQRLKAGEWPTVTQIARDVRTQTNRVCELRDELIRSGELVVPESVLHGRKSEAIEEQKRAAKPEPPVEVIKAPVAARRRRPRHPSASLVRSILEAERSIGLRPGATHGS